MKKSTIDKRIEKCYKELYRHCLDGFDLAGCYNNLDFNAVPDWDYIKNHGIMMLGDNKIQIPFEMFYIDEEKLESLVKEATKGTKSQWEFCRVKFPCEFGELEGKERLEAEFMYSNWDAYHKELELLCEKATNKKVFDALYKLLVEKYKKFMRKMNPDRDTISANIYLGPSPTMSKDVFNMHISDLKYIINNFKIVDNMDLNYVMNEMERLVTNSSNNRTILLATLYYISHITDRELVKGEKYTYYQW